jgi:hypothetical protein
VTITDKSNKSEEMGSNLSTLFPSYTCFDPPVPVWCVTPNVGRTIHRFFDTSPFSPSGRFLGLTRLPFEDRLPSPGDVAEIVLVDLATGKENVVAESRGWDTQLGAQVQWGNQDTQLCFNDLDTATWRVFGVVLDPFSGVRRVLDGPIYMVSPDGEWAASPCLLRTGVTQPGYGVIAPQEYVPMNHGASANDGLYITNTLSGECKLLLSFKEIVDAAIPPLDRREFEGGDIYGFHVKWNPQGNRLMFVLRWVPHQKGTLTRSQAITLKADGTHIHVAIPASEWDKGGHHPNWCPDGENLIMNLRVHKSITSRAYPHFLRKIQKWIFQNRNVRDDEMRLVRTRYNGGGCEVLSETVPGSGHPSLHPNGRYVVTDAYPHEPVAFGDGTVPIRLIDLDAGQDVIQIRIKTDPAYKGPRGELRVDPHPAWDHEYRRLAFNACVDGTRRVYVADLSSVLE